VFVAVPLSETAREHVAELVQDVRASIVLKPGAREARWVRLEGLHVTLRFLGPTEPDRLPAVEAAVRSVAADEASFPVTLGGAGAFPSPARPRALWLGIRGGAVELGHLAERLGRQLHDAGWAPDERPFRAHLTLARTDGVRGSDDTARRLIAAATAFETGWLADSLVLFESITGGGPARYEPLLRARLQGP
jgi:2'-5' RNA ligase